MSIRRIGSGLLATAAVFCLLEHAAMVKAQSSEPVGYDSEFTYRMLDHTTDASRKPLRLLLSRSEGGVSEKRLILGVGLNVIGDVQRSDTEAKFAYLMRHPTQNNQSGKTVSELVIHDAQIHATGMPAGWVTTYLEWIYNPQQSFGAGTITALERNQIWLHRGYVLLGDLSSFPLYGSIGKLETPFGLTDTVNPFTASTVWHAFGGLAYGGLIGYYRHGLHLSLMAIQGGAQFRSANSGDATPDDVANFTVNGSYALERRGASVRVGAGYIDGSAYCQPFPIVHFASCGGFENPAWDVFGLVKWNGLTLLAEYAQTTEEWPGTHNPNPPLSVYPAHDVSAFDIGVKYGMTLAFIPGDIAVSADFSRLKAGPDGSPWEKQGQLVFGFELYKETTVKFFAEYIRTTGYVPLNFISGPDPFDTSADPGTTHCAADATSNILIVGITAAM